MIYIRRVEGLSMAPHFKHGNIVVAWKFRKPKIGDVVIARHHRVEVIKRVKDMNDSHVFLLGDNPSESTDSREFGWLPLQAVLGVVLGGKK